MASFVIFLLSFMAFAFVGVMIAKLINNAANSIEKDNAKAEKEIQEIQEDKE